MFDKLIVVFISTIKMDSLKNISRARCRLVIHSAFLIHHLASCITLSTLDFTKATHQRLLDIRDFSDRYFTGWNFAFQMVFLALAIMCDVSEIIPDTVEKIWPSHKLIKRLVIARDFIFVTFVFPFTLFVCILFWTVYNYDRELVLPKVCDTVVPPLLNHALHTHIVAVVCVELVMSRKRKSREQSRQLFWLGVIVFAYFIVLMWTYLVTGRWIYAILGLFNWTERFIFLGTTVISIYVLYFVGCHINEIIGKKFHNTDNSATQVKDKTDGETKTIDNDSQCNGKEITSQKLLGGSGSLSYESSKSKSSYDNKESFLTKITKPFIIEKSDVILSELFKIYDRIKSFRNID